MPNFVNDTLYREFERDLREAGSCLLVTFDRLTVSQASDLRNRFREAGMSYRVVKNRLVARAVRSALNVDIASTLRGKCGIVFAREEKAIAAAKIVREAMKVHKKDPPVEVIGGIIEGEAITGPAAAMIADMPDRTTVNAQIATAIAGPARALATVVAALGSGLARCVQAKVDKG